MARTLRWAEAGVYSIRVRFSQTMRGGFDKSELSTFLSYRRTPVSMAEMGPGFRRDDNSSHTV